MDYQNQCSNPTSATHVMLSSLFTTLCLSFLICIIGNSNCTVRKFSQRKSKLSKFKHPTLAYSCPLVVIFRVMWAVVKAKIKLFNKNLEMPSL